MIKQYNFGGACELFDELLALFIVEAFNFFFVSERFQLRGPVIELKTGGVEANGIFFTAEVLYLDLVPL